MPDSAPIDSLSTAPRGAELKVHWPNGEGIERVHYRQLGCGGRVHVTRATGEKITVPLRWLSWGRARSKCKGGAA